MKKNVSWLLIIILVIIGSNVVFAEDAVKKATPSQTKFIIDNQEVVLDDVYNIEENNYIQLRLIAQMLNGTKSQFNVYWDDLRQQAVIETGKPYTGIRPFNYEKDIYKAGEPIVFGNTEITIEKIFKTPQISSYKDEEEYNNQQTIIADKRRHTITVPKNVRPKETQVNNGLYGITFKVITSEKPTNSEFWIASDFIKHVIILNGEIYDTFCDLDNQLNKVYPNKETTVTIYISINPKHQALDLSLIISDLKGNYKTIEIR